VKGSEPSAPAKTDSPASTGQEDDVRSAAVPPPAVETAIGSAIDRWTGDFRSGNIQAQAALYAPVVGVYFKLRNVTRQQVQRAQERAAAGQAGIQNYHVTTIGISGDGDGQWTALLQKDWSTSAGQGPGASGTEIEKLVFAQVAGQWKIVSEQDVKLPKVHRARVPR
jgi:ketosteroid isomerase-like protein